MSVFSDLLSEYITMKDVGVYPLSQFCGLDRSFMYKIINGKRNPSGEDVVRKMAQFMQLTPREKTDFMDAFYITQMGEEVYYRRKSVGELIETFSHREGKKEYIFHEAEIAKLELNGGGSGEIPLRGTVHVRHAILQLFFGEAVKEDGKISVLVQPDFDFAMELLQVFGEQNPNLTIQHLFCMNNNEKMVSMRKNYNLSCLQKILPICACGCDYRARYYYDNVTARLNEFRLFPYLILTEHCALAFSADYQNALLFREETTLRMMREMFEGYTKTLEVNGVGYRAAKQGNKLVLSLGYSHPVEMIDPEGLSSAVDGNKIIVSGISKEKVGQYAAEIRDKRRPEPYKGKGIKYADEVIRRKVGKTGKK